MPNSTSKRSKKAKRRARALRRAAIIICSVLAVAGILTGVTAGWFTRDDALDALPSDMIDNGEVRVFLKSLGRPEALGLTLDGVYTVEGDRGFRFARGTEISVAADEGTLLLTAGGLTIDMGQNFTLTRHAVNEGETNGIYIHESEKDALFAGDLRLSNEGIGIDAILTVQVEDYLYGVVPYEMSDSFPLEALKAQAVAARTYALRARKSPEKSDYDLVDTTQDQVYRGFDPANERAIQAVDETRGIVGMVNGDFAGCYFTASNGGQIATTDQAWGGAKESYIEMKDDPYDLENELSTVKRAAFSRTPDADSAVSLMLASALTEEMAARGMSDEISDIRVDEILSVVAQDADKPGSRMYRNIAFDVKVSGRRWTEVYAPDEPVSAAETEPIPGTENEPVPDAESESVSDLLSALVKPAVGQADADSGNAATAENMIAAENPSSEETDADVPDATEAEATPAEATPEGPQMVLGDWEAVEDVITVKLSTYAAVRNALSISINSSAYEVFEVEETADGFAVVSRRFGHGVGLSQRGAQTMAGRYGKNCEEILNFYYPGMALYRIEWQERTLAPLASLPASVGYARPRPTPKPTQIPLPPLTGDEYYARVVLETASSSLNVRQEPNTSCRVVGTLSKNDRVIVTGEADGGWFRIKTVELEGYVKGDYIEKE